MSALTRAAVLVAALSVVCLPPPFAAAARNVSSSQQRSGHITPHQRLRGVAREPPGFGVNMAEGAAKTLGLYIHGISIKELAAKDMKKVIDESTFKTESVDHEVIADELALSISKKLENYRSALRSSKSALEVLHFFDTVPNLARHQCCDVKNLRVNPDSSYNVAINKNLFCDISPPQSSAVGMSGGLPEDVNYSLAANLSSILSQNVVSHPGIHWQYFISTAVGRESLYPGWGQPGRSCQPHAVQHAQLLLKSLVKHPLHLVFIIDCSMSNKDLQAAKSTVAFMISQLREEDRVAVLSSQNQLNPHPAQFCLQGKLSHVTDSSKSRLLSKVISIRTCSSNFDLADDVNTANDILFASEGTTDAHILLFTDRFDSMSFSSAKPNTQAKLSVFKFSATNKQSLSTNMKLAYPNLGLQVQISNTSMYESFAKFCKFASSLNASETRMEEAILHNPFVDSVSGGFLLPLSQTVIGKDGIVGVVGLDLQASELLEDVAFTKYEEETRNIVITREGIVLSHPIVPTSDKWSHNKLFHIEELETGQDFSEAYRHIQSMPSGSDEGESEKFYWKHIEHSNLIVVIVSSSKSKISQTLENVPFISSGSRIQFHSLIPEGKSKLCRHLRDIASMETASLYLAPAAYSLPYENLIGLQVPLKIQSYMAYLTDPTRLIANPGLKRGVRESVSLLSHVVDSWKNLAFSSSNNNYIIRRRIVSLDGVQLSYPGTAVQDGYDPTKESWFELAVKKQDKVVFSPPRLDAGGAGFMITVSAAVSAPESAATSASESGVPSHDESTSERKLDSSREHVAVVISADFTLEYWYKLLNDTIPDQFCTRLNSRCFIFDDNGNMISHPHLSRDSMKYARFPAKVHLTHMESSIATDILVDQNFISKKMCNSLENGKLMRFFEVVGNRSAVYENQNKDECMRYRVTGIPGTNLWLGMVEESCHSTAFCWCSTLDTTCLECTSLDEERCECPCECSPPEDSGQCGRLQPPEDQDLAQPPVCSHLPKPYHRRRYSTTRFEHFPPCIHTDCSARESANECYGVLGCSWCDLDMDGVTPMHTPSCLNMDKCFGGVLQSVNPYSRIYDQSMVLADPSEDRSLSRAGPIGPVAGSIMAFFILLALSVWGYKHWTAGSNRALRATNGSSQRINQIEEDVDEAASGGGHHNFGLDSNQAISVVSPYRMNPSYRRPRPAGTDSDHGYSTMTPCGDQDSEVMSCLGEVGAHRRQRTRGPSSLHSVTSGNSSGTSSPLNAGHHELSTLSKGSCQDDLASERENLITVQHQTEAPNRNHHVSNGGHPTSGGRTVSGGVPHELAEGMTVLNNNQFLVSATVHMVDT